jgi:hypothetical protein
VVDLEPGPIPLHGLAQESLGLVGSVQALEQVAEVAERDQGALVLCAKGPALALDRFAQEQRCILALGFG